MEFTRSIHSIKGILIPTLTIAVTYIIGFANTSSCQWDLSKTPVVYQIGDTLVLNCTYTGPSLNLTHAAILNPHGNPLQIHHMTGSSSIVATNEINDCSQGGTYVCMPGQCGRTLRNVHTIRVEDSSRNPDLSCVYNSYYMALSNMTCKWRPNCEKNYYQWSLSYRNSTDSTFRPCETISHRTCVIPEVDTFQYETYELKLVQMEYLQPNRTFEYTLYTDQTVWRLEVCLNNISSTASDELNITLYVSERVQSTICEVHYTSQWKGTLNQVNYNVAYTPSLTVVLTLDGLEAYTTYNISIRCRPVQSNYWSKPIHAVYRTLPSAPNGLPGRIMFADEIKTSGRRQICFYWTPLTKRQRRGYQTEYTITYLNDEGRNGTDVFSSDTVTAMLKHTVLSDDETIVQIGTQNEAGISSTSRIIVIPAYIKDGYQTVVDSGSDTSNITAFWSPQSVLQGRQRSLVYYWCQGSRDGGRLPICNFPLQSKVSMDQTFTVNNSHHGNLNFGVSVGTDRKTLPKIVWSKCIFTNTVSDSLKAMDISLALYNSTALEVNLNTAYCDFDNMPTLYQVASYETSVNCSEGRDFTDFAAVPSLRTVYIPMVHRKMTFVCFRVLYKNGLTNNSGPFVIDLAKTGSDSEIPAGLIAGMALSSVLVLIVVLIFLARICRSRLEQLSKIEDVTVTVSPWNEAPNADSGHYVYTDSIASTDTRTFLNNDDCYDGSASVVNDAIALQRLNDVVPNTKNDATVLQERYNVVADINNDTTKLQEQNDELLDTNNEYSNSSGGVITYTSINHQHEGNSLTCSYSAVLDPGNEVPDANNDATKEQNDEFLDTNNEYSNSSGGVITYTSINHQHEGNSLTCSYSAVLDPGNEVPDANNDATKEQNDEFLDTNNEYSNSSGGVITYTSINHQHEGNSLTCSYSAVLDPGNKVPDTNHDATKLQEQNDEFLDTNSEYSNSSGGVITYTSINHQHEGNSLTCSYSAVLDPGNERNVGKSVDNSTDSAANSSNMTGVIYSRIDANVDITQNGGQTFLDKDTETFDDTGMSSKIVSGFKQSISKVPKLQGINHINYEAYSNDQLGDNERHIDNSIEKYNSNTEVPPLCDQALAYVSLDFNPSIHSSHSDSGESSSNCVSPMNSYVQTSLHPSQVSTSSNSWDTVGSYVMSTRLEGLPDVDPRMSAHAAQTGRIHLDVSAVLNTRTVDASSSDTSSDSAISSSGLSGVDDYVTGTVI